MTAPLDSARLAEAANHVLWYNQHLHNDTRVGYPDPTGFAMVLLTLFRLTLKSDNRKAHRLAEAFPEYGWCVTAAGFGLWDSLLECAQWQPSTKAV